MISFAAHMLRLAPFAAVVLLSLTACCKAVAPAPAPAPAGPVAYDSATSILLPAHMLNACVRRHLQLIMMCSVLQLQHLTPKGVAIDLCLPARIAAYARTAIVFHRFCLS